MNHETLMAQGPVECRVMPHTPGPWRVGEFNEHLGYDCMTGGVRAGPAFLDGSDYGQKRCAEIDQEAKARMLADAALIAAAPKMLAALQRQAANVDRWLETDIPATAEESRSIVEQMNTAIAAALGHNVELTGGREAG